MNYKWAPISQSLPFQVLDGKNGHGPPSTDNEISYMRNATWKHVHIEGRTFPALLNSMFQGLDDKYHDFLPNLRSVKTLLIGSDYSGESPNATYLVFSFLFTSMESWACWDVQRTEVRREFLRDSRRMSFKRLNDSQRKRALNPLLIATNSLQGLSFSVALNKQCSSIFAARPPLDFSNPEFAAYRRWKPAVLEKAFFALHTLGVLLGGLAAPDQNVMWFTDEDSIAANDNRVRELTQLFGWISSQYLTFNLGQLRCGTSKCDDGLQNIEDFLAIPDLIAGALAEQMQLRSPSESSKIFWVHRGDFSHKTREITWWFSDWQHSFKRLLCVVDPGIDDGSHLLSWFHFNDQKDEPDKSLHRE